MEDAKALLRAEMRRRRASMPESERRTADAVICERVCALPQFQEADLVLTYLSFGTEVETRGIIEHAWAAGKTVALPRCTASRRMRWFRVECLAGLEKSPFGLLEPSIDEKRELNPAICVNAVAFVPGLTFDDQGFRLGYGGGYYDVFLNDFPGLSIGLCRCDQLVSSLEAFDAVLFFDRTVDIVATEAFVHRVPCRKSEAETSCDAPAIGIASGKHTRSNQLHSDELP